MPLQNPAEKEKPVDEEQLHPKEVKLLNTKSVEKNPFRHDVMRESKLQHLALQRNMFAKEICNEFFCFLFLCKKCKI